MNLRYAYAETTLLLLLALLPGISLAQPQDLLLTDDDLSGTYTAAGTITARDATVRSGSDATLRAGERVRLEPGFKAELGATFRAEVDASLVGGGSGTCDLAALDVPLGRGNARFFPVGVTPFQHPSLSINGFDCEASKTGCGSGLGLKQILEAVPPSGSSTPVEIVYNRILLVIAEGAYDPDPQSRSAIEANVQRMQGLAFEALASYVLERNAGCDAAAFGLRDHATAIQELRAALLNGRSWRIERGLNGDGVKWTWLTGDAGRALDLYLALEVAYKHYGERGHQPSADEYADTTSSRLLSRDDKRDVLIHYSDQLRTLDAAARWGFPPGFDRYGAEPGNAALKLQTALGYAALPWQNPYHPVVEFDDFNTRQKNASDYITRALEAAFRLSGDNRLHYFDYQTGGGEYYWAEGQYYFQFALGDLLPFWHAVRANDLLDWYGRIPEADPFRDAPYTRPFHWLADTATPDAKTPPLDDGNKHRMRNAMLLRWTDAYGDAELGRKFAWIANRTPDSNNGSVFGTDDNLLLVELAIPRLGLNDGTVPVSCVSDASGCAPGGDAEPQQLIVRREDDEGQTHYVLLNGERGDAITHGEGHEQPDNMQLLYYVDGASLLMDSGYDDATTSARGILSGDVNSTWNHYYDHNVLNIAFGEYERYDGGPGPLPDNSAEAIEGDPPEGGIEPPRIGVGRKGIRDHSVAELRHRQAGNLDILHATQELTHSDLTARYNRDVLFVGGAVPYLIDLNRAYSSEGGGDRLFRLNYYAKVSGLQIPPDWGADGGRFFRWGRINFYPAAIEYELRSDRGDVRDVRDLVEEDFRDDLRFVDRLDIQDDGRDQISFVSFILPRPDVPANSLKLVRSRNPNARTYYQAWAWQQDPSTIDVYAARSMLESVGTPDFTFNVQDADPAFPDFSLVLADNEAFGFVRLKQENGEWRIESGYQINLQLPPPVTLRIPNQNQVGQAPELAWTWNEDPLPNATFEIQRTTDYVSWSQIGQPTTGMNYTDASVTIARSDGADDFYRYRILVRGRGYSNVASVFAEDKPPYLSKDSEPFALADQALEAVPDDYALEAAYPNPFNPQATIRFALPEAADVRLVVYDVVGREVARLAEGEMGAGFHRATFDGSRLASGLYLYRLTARGAEGAFAETGRMTLVK